MRQLLLLALAVVTALAAETNQAQYAGPQICSKCHSEIARTQAETAMANSWHGMLPTSFPSSFSAIAREGPEPGLSYQIRRISRGLQYTTSAPDLQKAELPVEAVVGGERHGFSFLERVNQVGGLPLERPALVEARYAYNLAHRKLLLSAGFDPEKPTNYEDALGRTLSPEFERKCLTCHGQPNTQGAGTQGGVRCESCHGGASEHVNSVTSSDTKAALVKPLDLRGDTQLEACGQCHSGLSDRSDPMPDDLLVSNQVPALRNSECFLQSGHAVTCSGCHNPHQDSAKLAETSQRTCLGCHSGAGAQRAAICPVNAKEGCVGCHMPAVQKGTFLMTDHWIRVHPEQNIKSSRQDAALRSRVTPKHEYLRLISVETHAAAEAALQRLLRNEPFAQVARQVSIDTTAPGGGYIGDMELSQMDAKLAAAAALLSPATFSPVVDLGSRFVILYRMPRDFKWQADQLYQQAVALKAKGDLKAAGEKDQRALDIYPYFLRALVLMGTTLGEAGDARRAGDILQFAAQMYPKDPSAQFDYALTLSGDPGGQIEAFQHALELNPDLTAAYESLGAAQFANGQPQRAISTFRAGLQIDPLSAPLYYNLSLALAQQGDEPGAKSARSLAQKLDPQVLTKPAAHPRN